MLHVTSPPFTSPHDASQYPRVVISYKIRSLAKETPFWSAFGLWFSFEPVLARCRTRPKNLQEDIDNSWARFGSPENSDTFIFIGSRRPESFGWDVPSKDQDLLSGVGARGTNDQKYDSTFEELLLMQLEV